MLRRLLDKVRGRKSEPRQAWNPWEPILKRDGKAWTTAREAARGGPLVLMAPGAGGFHLGSLMESTLAVALTLRGARAEVFLCDSALPACQLTEIANDSPKALRAAPPQPRCRKCESRGREVFDPLGLETHWLGRLLSEEKKAQARDLARSIPLEGLGAYRFDGLGVGEHAVAGALRYFARGDLEGEPCAGELLRHYLQAALRTVFALEELLDRRSYDVACFNHGIYVPQGLIGEVCRRRGVRVVNWNPAYRKSSFIFSHGDSYHHTMISEPTSYWEDLPWSERIEHEALAYLRSRRTGSQDWIWFHQEPQEDSLEIAREIGIDFQRTTVALLTNVMWDAQLHYRSNAFPSMLDWVLETIRYFAGRPDLQLVIRVHPAELRGGIPSRQLLEPEIEKAYPQLPSNVFVVGPGSQVSTYSLAEQCNAVIIYNTKTGIELSSMGIPVIVAGEAWIRGKSFSLDAVSPESYRKILDSLPLQRRLDAEKLQRAQKYAYHFFFRRMIPVPLIHKEGAGTFALECGSLKELLPGQLKGLDVICDGILNGSPFIYPAERLS